MTKNVDQQSRALHFCCVHLFDDAAAGGAEWEKDFFFSFLIRDLIFQYTHTRRENSLVKWNDSGKSINHFSLSCLRVTH